MRPLRPPPETLPFLQLLPNLVTILGLCVGLTALRLTFAGRFEPAVALLVFAALLDGFDGLLARKLQGGKPFRGRARFALGLRQLRRGAGAPRLPDGARGRRRRQLDRRARLRGLRLPPPRALQRQPRCAGRSARRTSSASRRRRARSSACSRRIVDLRRHRRRRALPWLVAPWLAAVGLLMVCRLRTFAPKGLRISRKSARWLLVGVALARRAGAVAVLAADDRFRRRLSRHARRTREAPPPAARRRRPGGWPMKPEAVATSYRRWAPVYDQTFGAFSRLGRRRAVEEVNRRSGSVLEVGVGTGLSLAALRAAPARHRHRLLGRDARPRRGQGRRPRAHPRGRAPADGRPQPRLPRRQLRHRRRHARDLGGARAGAGHRRDGARSAARAARCWSSTTSSTSTGALGWLGRRLSPLADQLGWHSDFTMAPLLSAPSLELVEQRPSPPFGMFTRLLLRKHAG